MTDYVSWRQLLYRRFSCLWPLGANRVVKIAFKSIFWALVSLLVICAIVAMMLRFWLFPRIDEYRGQIEALASERLGAPVHLGVIESSWQYLRPELTVRDIRVGAGSETLTVSSVRAVVSWLSVPTLSPRLHLLEVTQPNVTIRRDGDGHLFVAGMPVNAGSDDSSASDWLFAQRHVRVSDASIVWEDERRHAPLLKLNHVQMSLDNLPWSHKFSALATPPRELAAVIDLRGALRNTHIKERKDITGSLYVALPQLDIEVAKQWADLPVDVKGGVVKTTSWLTLSQGEIEQATSDFSVAGASIRLAANLSQLSVNSLSGRLSAKLDKKQMAFEASNVTLSAQGPAEHEPQTIEKIVLSPIKLKGAVSWPLDAKIQGGNLVANLVEIGEMRQLGRYLPLPAQVLNFSRDYEPAGTLRDISARWRAQDGVLSDYALQGKFEKLALKANGHVPGFAGLSGNVDLTEKGGSLAVASSASSIDLPAVFSESLITLSSLNVAARWSMTKEGVVAELTHCDFAGEDAAGEASGTYRQIPGSAGYIDLQAGLKRGQAQAVWRYMPLVVNVHAREWLHRALQKGYATDTKLVLKGDLKNFPFADPKLGQFLVTVNAHDVTLDYGEGWPKITGIDGKLRFEGFKMLVEAEQGHILNTRLSKTRAEIPNLDAKHTLLLVNGEVDGPTGEFLKFIDQSPVANKIDHFTESMRAVGAGHLDLGLEIPLEEALLDQAKVDGTYHFKKNDVTVDSGMPPLRQVSGQLKFSANDLTIPEINATLLGGPLKIQGGLQDDGRVLITANGSLSTQQIKKQLDLPLLDHLSGATQYRGEVRVNKRNADLVIESALTGISSSLPAPFNKSASSALPLRIEKKLLPATATAKGESIERDVINAQLGNNGHKVLEAQLLRKKQAGSFVVDRGAIAIGRALELPSSGTRLLIGAASVNADLWRSLMPPSTPVAAKSTSDAGSFIDSVNIKTPELRLLDHRLSDVDLTASVSGEGVWRSKLQSNEAKGELSWDSRGDGKLTARLKQFTIDAKAFSATANAQLPSSNRTDNLPAVDLVAENFQIDEKRLGHLEIFARNDAQGWLLDRVQIANPDGKLNGKGRWVNQKGQSLSELSFNLQSENAGKLLERLGYPGTLRGGTANLTGDVKWQGAPVDFDYTTLNGELKLNASKGQFVKLDPGAAGKLLALISLQGLPRRITLDFHDVFSEGLAFDAAESKIAINHGVMHTDKLQIDGPSAHVLMNGDVNLKQETQRLNVRVQPELGSSAALGVALVNPIAGVATLLAHKVLQNPLNQIFEYHYLVTGTWDDPKVDKVARSAANLPTGVSNESGK